MNTLNTLSLGQKACVVSINCPSNIKQRLLDLGLVPNTIITPILRSPSNCTVAYEFRGSTIALRNDDAKYIYIE